MNEESEEEGFSLYEYYLNTEKESKKKLKNPARDELKNHLPKVDYCFWNVICRDLDDVFDSDGFATRADRRFGHSSIYLAKDEEIYVFGGFSEEEKGEVADFWKFNIPLREWTELYPKSDRECWPRPVCDHTALSVSLSQKRFENFVQVLEIDIQLDNSTINPTINPYYNQMYLFGGFSSRDQFNNQLYCFDFSVKKFIKIEYGVNGKQGEKENTVKERSRHAMVSVSDRYLYIIGGMTHMSSCLMDVWEYDIDSQQMECIWNHREEDSDFYPNSRCYHSCTYSKTRHSIFMFGGIRNSIAFQDLWKFDLHQCKWYQVDMHGFVPVDRFQHISFISNEESDYFFVYGGYNFKHSFLDNVYQFCFTTGEWTRLQNRNYTNGGSFESKGSILFVDYNETPIARSGTSKVITKDGDLIIFGGKAGPILNDMYICHLPGYCKISARNHLAENLLCQLYLNHFSDVVLTC